VRAVYADTTGAPHTWQGSTWNSGDMTNASNSSYRYRFTTAGTFAFFCAYHQSVGMTGTVTVT
jgi:plastocyanin